MDFTPTYDQREYLEAAVAFADDALKPHAAPLDKEHEFPMPTIKLTQWGEPLWQVRREAGLKQPVDQKIVFNWVCIPTGYR